MKVEIDGRQVTPSLPARFGRSPACELQFPTVDRTVPNLLGQIHIIDGEVAVSNLHQRVAFNLIVAGASHQMIPGMTARVRRSHAIVRVPSAPGAVFRITLDLAEIRPRRQKLDLGGPGTVVPRRVAAFKESHLRDLAALFEPTLVSADFSVIRSATWAEAAARLGDDPANLKARVLRTIAAQAESFGCPELARDARQVLGRWLIDSGVLTAETLELLNSEGSEP